MDFELTPRQRGLRKKIITFAQQELGGNVVADDRDARFPLEDWRKCAAYGVLGWPVPARYGGREFDPLTTIIALEALGYGCRDNGLVFAIGNHLWGCAIYLVAHGTEEQKNRFLKPMCEGELIGAHALSEPEAGSDMLSLQTTAVREGDHYLLSGTKCFISNGPEAGVFVVFARTGDGGGRAQNELSAFLVTSDMPGVRKAKELFKLGLRTTPMGVVEFDRTPVPAANLIGREGAGYPIFTSTIEWERCFMFAGQVGAMERLLEASLEHAGSRRQFGRPIGSFQAVAHQIADMKIRLELARLILYRVGWLKREGRFALLDSTIAKIFISESLVQTALAAVEVHGARGYVTDLGIERELRDALGGPIYAGTSAVQRGVLAELLGLNGALSEILDDRSPAHRIALDPPVPEAHAGELASRVFFVSEAILDFALVRSEGAVRAVDVTLPEAAVPDLDDLTRKLRFVVANDVLAQKRLAPKVIWRGTGTGPPRDVFDDLLDRGAATEAGEGQIALGEPLLSLMDHLDARIRSLTMAEFGAREFRYPTLIPVAAMGRCGYFQSFPQLMMFVSRLHGDVDSYRGFLDEVGGGGDLASGLRAHSDHFDYCLPPTMCFHTYHQLADRPLDQPSLVVTSRGKSFRFESRYRRSLERLWDFTIREIVFLGSREFVLASRQRLMECGFDLVEALGLGGHCEVANDPFFIDPSTAERVWSQHLLESKYELRLPLDPSRDVAVGSFNFHDRFFGDSFGIHTPDGPVFTACAGFGLERLAYAFVCRHGLDPEGWPSDVREALAS